MKGQQAKKKIPEFDFVDVSVSENDFLSGSPEKKNRRKFDHKTEEITITKQRLNPLRQKPVGDNKQKSSLQSLIDKYAPMKRKIEINYIKNVNEGRSMFEKSSGKNVKNSRGIPSRFGSRTQALSYLKGLESMTVSRKTEDSNYPIRSLTKVEPEKSVTRHSSRIQNLSSQQEKSVSRQSSRIQKLPTQPEEPSLKQSTRSQKISTQPQTPSSRQSSRIQKLTTQTPSSRQSSRIQKLPIQPDTPASRQSSRIQRKVGRSILSTNVFEKLKLCKKLNVSVKSLSRDEVLSILSKYKTGTEKEYDSDDEPLKSKYGRGKKQKKIKYEKRNYDTSKKRPGRPKKNEKKTQTPERPRKNEKTKTSNPEYDNLDDVEVISSTKRIRKRNNWSYQPEMLEFKRQKSKAKAKAKKLNSKKAKDKVVNQLYNFTSEIKVENIKQEKDDRFNSMVVENIKQEVDSNNNEQEFNSMVIGKPKKEKAKKPMVAIPNVQIKSENPIVPEKANEIVMECNVCEHAPPFKSKNLFNQHLRECLPRFLTKHLVFKCPLSKLKTKKKCPECPEEFDRLNAKLEHINGLHVKDLKANPRKKNEEKVSKKMNAAQRRIEEHNLMIQKWMEMTDNNNNNDQGTDPLGMSHLAQVKTESILPD